MKNMNRRGFLKRGIGLFCSTSSVINAAEPMRVSPKDGARYSNGRNAYTRTPDCYRRACLRMELERPDVKKYSSAGYVDFTCGNCITSALHGIRPQNRPPVDLEWVSFVNAFGERFALDNGLGSREKRLSLESQGVVGRTNYFVALDGLFLALEDLDVVVFRIAEPLPGMTPLLAELDANISYGDDVTVLVSDYREVGIRRRCNVGNADYLLDARIPCLQFFSEGSDVDNLVFSGDSGGLVLGGDDASVLGILLRIRDRNVRDRSGGYQRVVSNDALAVRFGNVFATAYNRWKRTDPLLRRNEELIARSETTLARY